MFFVNFDREIWCFSQMWNNIWNMKISFSQKDASHVTHIKGHRSHVTYESRHIWVTSRMSLIFSVTYESSLIWCTSRMKRDAHQWWVCMYTHILYFCLYVDCNLPTLTVCVQDVHTHDLSLTSCTHWLIPIYEWVRECKTLTHMCSHSFEFT